MKGKKKMNKQYKIDKIYCKIDGMIKFNFFKCSYDELIVLTNNNISS